MIVDDGNISRSNRKNLLNEDVKYLGFAKA